MAGLLSSASSHLILHHLPRSPPPTQPSPSSLLSLFLFKPLTAVCHHAMPFRTISSTTASLSSRPLFFHTPSLSLSSSQTLPNTLPNSQLTLEPETKHEFEDTNEEEEEEEIVSEPTERAVNLNSSLSALKLPSLSVKEKKELASYAHSLGKKLKSQQVGKSGVTDSVATALIETLEANELLKLKIHRSCPGELEEAVKQLQQATGSLVVGQIGRTVILYRPSLTKLKAEEKKNQARRIFRRKQLPLKPSFENKGQPSRFSGRGRRGSSRSLSSP